MIRYSTHWSSLRKVSKWDGHLRLLPRKEKHRWIDFIQAYEFYVICLGVSKEIKRRAEGVQVELYHQTIKQMADYISFSRQACLVALAGHWQIQDIYLRNISDADVS